MSKALNQQSRCVLCPSDDVPVDDYFPVGCAYRLRLRGQIPDLLGFRVIEVLYFLPTLLVAHVFSYDSAWLYLFEFEEYVYLVLKVTTYSTGTFLHYRKK